MTSAAIIGEAAARIREAYHSLVPCAPVRDLVGADNVAAAYAVQEHNTQLWLGEGRRIAGRKIGLTAKSVQKQLGVGERSGRVMK